MSEIFTGSLIEPVLLLLGSVGFFFFAIQAYRQLEKWLHRSRWPGEIPSSNSYTLINTKAIQWL